VGGETRRAGISLCTKRFIFPKRDRYWGGLKSMLAVLAPAPPLPLAVRKNYQAGMMTILSLTVLSNVVAYAGFIVVRSAQDDGSNGRLHGTQT